ncbi:MAG TPA: DUF1488 domain-containing protein [Pseudolabrys sp.]|nr:DUF1488 domain-containing protein [Pseudolabrys sp.]
MVARMPLNFPNQSRSYDARQRCVRFWAYDEALEIPFFVEADALCHIDPKATKDEAGLLSVFDVHRGRICKAADRVYSRRRRGSYTLAVSDMK